LTLDNSKGKTSPHELPFFFISSHLIRSNEIMNIRQNFMSHALMAALLRQRQRGAEEEEEEEEVEEKKILGNGNRSCGQGSLGRDDGRSCTAFGRSSL
jgi:hypothetical protein